MRTQVTIFGVCLVTVSLAAAQDAELSGVVRDTSGAVIPKAAVHVLNTKTGGSRATETNESGLYSLPSLAAGAYDVDVTAQGFKKFVRTDLELHVAQRASLDFTLEVGTLEESIAVTAGPQIINAADGSVGLTVNRKLVDNIPLNGRTFQQLITQAPGVSLAPPTAQGGQFTVNGQRPTANYVTVDGASANVGNVTNGNVAGGTTFGANVAGGTNSLISVDALEEFRILTSSYAPEYGRSPGGQIIIRTRSGTNQFHGSAFEYLRNDVLDANDWFANATGKPHPPLRFNDFGGVFSGPIIRNKTFFFFSYEGQRMRQPQFIIAAVPSLSSRQSAAATTQQILNAYPLPNGPNLTNGQAQLAAGFSNPTATDAVSLRVDQAIGSRITLFGKYNAAPSTSESRNSALALSVVQRAHGDLKAFTSGLTYIVTPRLANQFTLNWTDSSLATSFLLDNFMGSQPLSSQAFPASLDITNSRLSFSLGVAGMQLADGIGNSSRERQANLVDGADYTVGAHQLKLGIDYRRLLPVDGAGNTLIYSFAGVPGVVNNAPTTFIRSTAGRVHADLTNLSLYSQDTWHVASGLTLTYGLRWELNTPPRDRDPNNGNYVPLLGDYTNPGTLHTGPVGSSLWNTQYKSIAPRFGLAYQLRGKNGWETVIRSGVGLFYDSGYGRSVVAPFALAFPNAITNTVSSGAPFPGTAEQVLLPTLDLTNPPAGQTFFTFPSDLLLPRTWEWNAAVEQAIGSRQAFTASYVAALGRKLLYQQRAGNLGSKNYTLNYTDNEGTSSYHSLQLQFQRRVSRGLAATMAYTWQHSIDTLSDDVASVAPTAFLTPAANRGSSDFDVRHTVNGAMSYDVPHSEKMGQFLNTVIRDWGLDAIVTSRTALPVDIGATKNIGFGNFTVRPDIVSGAALYLFGPQYAGGRAINPAAFVIPTTRQGTLGRNSLRGFGLFQMDASARRTLSVTEHLKVLFRADVFNIFNHPNFANPVSTVGTGTFGTSTSMLNSQIGGNSLLGALNPLFQVGAPRSIQLSLKLQF
jgi:hypothetical protein